MTGATALEMTTGRRFVGDGSELELEPVGLKGVCVGYLPSTPTCTLVLLCHNSQSTDL